MISWSNAPPKYPYRGCCNPAYNQRASSVSILGPFKDVGRQFGRESKIRLRCDGTWRLARPPVHPWPARITLNPVITQCCVEALYKLGKEHQRLVDLAKRFERRKCNHREAIDPNDCLKDVIGKLRSGAPQRLHPFLLSDSPCSSFRSITRI